LLRCGIAVRNALPDGASGLRYVHEHEFMFNCMPKFFAYISAIYTENERQLRKLQLSMETCARVGGAEKR